MKSKEKTIHSQSYVELIHVLKKERLRLSLSQDDIAEHLTLGQSDISKIENCERRLDVLELRRLLKAYKVEKNMKLQTVIVDYFVSQGDM